MKKICPLLGIEHDICQSIIKDCPTFLAHSAARCVGKECIAYDDGVCLYFRAKTDSRGGGET